jgi:hypothetical protein
MGHRIESRVFYRPRGLYGQATQLFYTDGIVS